jgi:hypothetical protein
MFMATIWTLTYKQRLRDINCPITVVAVALLVLSTAVSFSSHIYHHLLKSPKYMVVDIVRTENGFVKYRDTFPGGPAAYFGDVTQPLYVTKYSLLTLQTMVGDGVLVGPIVLDSTVWAHRSIFSG